MKQTLICFLLLIPFTISGQQIEEILNSRQYVLEATRISNGMGHTTQSVPGQSFILVDSSRIIIQWISTTNLIGDNGLGGYTREGTIYYYKVFENVKKKKEIHTVKLRCRTPYGLYKITMIFYHDGRAIADSRREASAYVSTNQKMKNDARLSNIHFNGKVVRLEEANTQIGIHKKLNPVFDQNVIEADSSKAPGDTVASGKGFEEMHFVMIMMFILILIQLAGG